MIAIKHVTHTTSDILAAVTVAGDGEGTWCVLLHATIIAQRFFVTNPAKSGKTPETMTFKMNTDLCMFFYCNGPPLPKFLPHRSDKF